MKTTGQKDKKKKKGAEASKGAAKASSEASKAKKKQKKATEAEKRKRNLLEQQRKKPAPSKKQRGGHLKDDGDYDPNKTESEEEEEQKKVPARKMAAKKQGDGLGSFREIYEIAKGIEVTLVRVPGRDKLPEGIFRDPYDPNIAPTLKSRRKDLIHVYGLNVQLEQAQQRIRQLESLVDEYQRTIARMGRQLEVAQGFVSSASLHGPVYHHPGQLPQFSVAPSEATTIPTANMARNQPSTVGEADLMRMIRQVMMQMGNQPSSGAVNAPGPTSFAASSASYGPPGIMVNTDSGLPGTSVNNIATPNSFVNASLSDFASLGSGSTSAGASHIDVGEETVAVAAVAEAETDSHVDESEEEEVDGDETEEEETVEDDSISKRVTRSRKTYKK